MVIKFYDTMTGKKVEFKPKEEGNLYIYVCGFTPNNYPHVGHARTAIIFDIIRRVFAKNGYNVHYLTNFTDIDDKIIAKANEEGISYEDVSSKYISAYLKAMELLNVSPPIMYARVTENIDIIVEMISGLIEKKHAYESNGDVYFSVRSFKNYGKLSKRSIREMLIGARVEPEEGKKDPLDFALWKKAKEGEPYWDSPWGKGRPGWHIECSAMSLKYLGNSLDIHGGAQDLIFPHHENEIAQSEAYTGISPFARYWIHTGWVTKDSEKMSKSIGNVFGIDEILKIVSPNVLRFFLISTLYSSPLEFQMSAISQADKTFEKILITAKRLDEAILASPKGAINSDVLKIFKCIDDDFSESLTDNFNTPLAISNLINACKETNKVLDRGGESYDTLSQIRNYLNDWLDTLGFKNVLMEDLKIKEDTSLKNNLILLAKKYEIKLESENIEEIVNRLIELRNEKRKNREFSLADNIRDDLLKLGIQLEDKKDSTVYRLVRDIDVSEQNS